MSGVDVTAARRRSGEVRDAILAHRVAQHGRCACGVLVGRDPVFIADHLAEAVLAAPTEPGPLSTEWATQWMEGGRPSTSLDPLPMADESEARRRAARTNVEEPGAMRVVHRQVGAWHWESR